MKCDQGYFEAFAFNPRHGARSSGPKNIECIQSLFGLLSTYLSEIKNVIIGQRNEIET